jgi:hypothetical protein
MILSQCINSFLLLALPIVIHGKGNVSVRYLKVLQPQSALSDLDLDLEIREPHHSRRYRLSLLEEAAQSSGIYLLFQRPKEIKNYDQSITKQDYSHEEFILINEC